MSQFTELFRPARLRGLTLRNRIIMPSMLTQFASAGGEVSDRLVAYYAERAKGGAGLVIPEATAVDDSGLSYFPGLSIAHDRFMRMAPASRPSSGMPDLMPGLSFPGLRVLWFPSCPDGLP